MSDAFAQINRSGQFGLAPTAAERRMAAFAILRTLSPVLLVLVLAILQQVLGGLTGDISWLITVGEEVLDGKRAYVDILEVNPPASILLYIPAVVAARLSGAPPEFMTALLCFVSIGASLTLSAIILVRARLADRIDPLVLAGALAVLALLPAHNFAQREHIAVIVGLPFFSALIAQASGARVDAGLRLLAGLGAGAMASIKPHFALMILAVLPYFIWRVGWKAAVASIELYIAALVCALYAAAVLAFFPAYADNVAPLVFALYLPLRYSWPDMASGTAFVSWLVLSAYLVVAARDRIGHPVVALPALASCGGMLAYFIQGKAWAYQSYPAIALAAIALVLATPRSDGVRRFIPGALGLAPAVAILLVAPETRSSFAVMLAPIGALAIAAGILNGSAPQRRGAAAGVSRLALGFLAAVLWSWFNQQGRPFSFEAKAAALAPHPSVLAITGDLNVGFPFVRRIGGVWVQRVASLWITSGARALLKGETDPPAIATLQSYLRLDRDMLVDDIRRNRPDLILISNRVGEFRDWAFNDPLIAAALAGYRLYASDGKIRGETFLYARADLIPLRPSFADPAEPARGNGP